MDNGKKERVDNGNVRCCDCERFSYATGTCDAGADALAELGYPLIAYRPNLTSDARRCPSFEPTEEYTAECEVPEHVRNGVRPGVDFPASL